MAWGQALIKVKDVYSVIEDQLAYATSKYESKLSEELQNYWEGQVAALEELLVEIEKLEKSQ